VLWGGLWKGGHEACAPAFCCPLPLAPTRPRLTRTPNPLAHPPKRTPQKTLNLAGIFKDVLLIGLSVSLYRSTVGSLQFLGYGLALGGVVYYNWTKFRPPPGGAAAAGAQKAAAAGGAAAAAGAPAGERQPLLPAADAEAGGGGSGGAAAAAAAPLSS
jgi:hypothetical protein